MTNETITGSGGEGLNSKVSYLRLGVEGLTL